MPHPTADGPARLLSRLLLPLALLAGCAQDADDPATDEPPGASDASADAPPDSPPDAPENDPDAGDAPTEPGDSGDGGDAEGERFTALFTDVLEPANCANAYCHHVGAESPEGPDLPEAFWRWLTTSVSESSPCGEDRLRFVVPGEPEASLFYLKVAPGVEICGEKMPAGSRPGGLSAAEAERVRAWIAGGARF